MIPVMIVGEVDLVRGALAAVLAHEDDLEVTTVLPLREEVTAAARAHRPAVVVIDVDRFGAAWPEIARQLADELPQCRVLLLASHPTVAVLRRAVAAGVWSLASSDRSPDQLARSIRQVAAGEREIDPALATAALRLADNPLSHQERAVLGLAAEGLRAPDIAQRLFLSPGTVRNHLSAAIRKTGARSRADAVRRAQEAGWL